MQINEKDIIKYYDFLNHKGVTEIRLIKPRWAEEKILPPSFFIKDATELVGVVKKFNSTWNIYIGINSRSCNGKEDKDVQYITNIGHDIDAHESGAEGLATAKETALKIAKDCVDMGYEEPLIMNSGFGYWIIHHIEPIPNEPENIERIKLFGKQIKAKYEVAGISLDSTVYNPSRIGRVAGTFNLREKNKPVIATLLNNPSGVEDIKLKEDILKIELPVYKPAPHPAGIPSFNSFMDYCLTHQLPKGERHKVISRNIALYICDHPDRELLKQQYYKIQKGSAGELDQYLKQIDKNGKEAYPFSMGELVNFTKKYKIPFNWKITPEYQSWQKEKKAEALLQKEIIKEEKAEQLGKVIKQFNDMRHLATQFLQVQPMYYDKGKIWWVWDFILKCWVITDETDILNYINTHSEADTIPSKERNEILEALRQVARKNKPQPLERSWIQFKDKIVDIYTAEEIEPTPAYFTTNPIPWDLGDSEETPTMDTIFEQWVGKEYVATLYEILAYCLLTDYPIHRIFCFIGEGLNGKSKFLDLMQRFVGTINCTATELDCLLSSRFEVARLHKKLVCQMGETNFGELRQTSMIKKLSGGDLIGFEYKGKNPFEDKNYAKIIISTNNLPTTMDKTVGFYRRWFIIDFPNKFTEKKDILLDIPDHEYNNLASKSVGILQKLLTTREFTNEGEIEERMRRYEEKSNFLDKFFNERVVKEFDGYITKAEFYKRFLEWSKEHKHRELSNATVNQNLRKNGIEEGQKYFDWMYDGRGGQVKVWFGVKWKD